MATSYPMTPTSPNNVIGKLRGKELVYANIGSNTPWKSYEDLLRRLKGQNSNNEPRIFSVQSTVDRPKDSKNKRESLDVFCEDAKCKKYMTETLQFPNHLFTEGWCKGNGFAGFKTGTDGRKLSWFRILVKWVTGLEEQDYRWYEMTYFIHQSATGALTVLIFEVPDKTPKGKPDDQPSQNGNIDSQAHHTTITQRINTRLHEPPFHPEVEPYDFLGDLSGELAKYRQSPGWTIDWKFMQARLLQQSIAVVDKAVWACSKTVRHLEKNRLDPKNLSSGAAFNFPDAHNLLRHALHLAETLEVASNTLHTWIIQFEKSEKRLYRTSAAQQNTSNQSPLLSDDDIDLPESSYHDSLAQSLQLLTNLQARSRSNEARLRNEISLAFNLVSQADTRAMRIISLVTLLFLPATFVSTLFSMSFFNQGYEWGVSYKIWIYAAVSIPLTVFAVILWVYGEGWLAQINKLQKDKEKKS